MAERDEIIARDMFEVLPLTHIRGRSLHDAFVIVDEAQSLERGVLLTVLSRIGTDSRVVLTHDIAQRDPNRTRRAAAAREADRLAPRLPRLVIKLDPPVADATVTSNGVDVGALLGVESPVDLGDYAIVARAPGYAEAQSHAKITDEGKTVVVAIALARPVDRPVDRPVIEAPARVGSCATSAPESCSACRAAARTSWAKRSILRAALRSIHSVGSKPFSSHAKWTG